MEKLPYPLFSIYLKMKVMGVMYSTMHFEGNCSILNNCLYSNIQIIFNSMKEDQMLISEILKLMHREYILQFHVWKSIIQLEG